MDKNWYKPSSGFKTFQKKTFFFMVLGPILPKIVFWKQKLPNVVKNTENRRFFESQTIINLQKLAKIGRTSHKKIRLDLYTSCLFFCDFSVYKKVWRKKARQNVAPQKKQRAKNGVPKTTRQNGPPPETARRKTYFHCEFRYITPPNFSFMGHC
jgi:hypothetical protein